jgi:glycosyltransferase involved in cell wall biosynthesis
LRLGIDCQLLDAPSGIGRYTRSLIRGLLSCMGEDDELSLLTHKQMRVEGYPAGVRSIAVGMRQRLLWANLTLPSLVRGGRFDLYHALDNMSLPLLWPKGRVKYVLTVHDVIPLLTSRSVKRRHRYYFTAFIRRILHLADAIIVDADWTKGLLVERYPEIADRVEVIPLGVDLTRFRPIREALRLSQVRKRYGIGERAYLLFTGVIEPKKNLAVLLRAYAQLVRSQGIHRCVGLVIAGPTGWRYREVLDVAATLGLLKDVVFTGPIEEDDLPTLYAGAELFVFPSLYEGFGLPPLEAMACGTPVIASDRGALPEVVGEAGVLINPEDIEGLAGQIDLLLADTGRRAALRQAGLARVQCFTWEKCAQRTFATYESMIAKT